MDGDPRSLHPNGGFMLFEGQDAKGTLTPEQLEKLLGERRIDFPAISRAEIWDRSKGDALSKGLVIAQTTWFIIQCVARKVKGLDTTQMELVTLAFATLNGVMYFLWWDKPLDIRCPVPVYLLETPKDPTNLDASSDTNTLWSAWLKRHWIQFCDSVRRMKYWASRKLRLLKQEPWFMIPWIILFRSPGTAIWLRFDDFLECNEMFQEEQMRVPTLYAFAGDPDNERRRTTIFSVLATVFGAMHCVGWRYQFPTNPELLLWRVCSVLVTTIPSLVIALLAFLGAIEDLGAIGDSDDNVLAEVLVLACTPLVYILARLSLLVEAHI
ncbi:hypothetical protein BU17DRAFT_97222 [Hysterangium stoloniferum]|nr:hypothetical protein BU17DRAFT_97222 [Hysterangium stoloniferum]